MNTELLTVMARYVASRQLAEGGKEAVILEQLKGAASRLASLFRDWKLDFSSQEAMLCTCCGFRPREAVLQPMMVPVLPPRPLALRQLLASRPVILFETSGANRLLGTCDPLLGAYQGQLECLLGQGVDLVYLTPEEVDAGRRKLADQLSEVIVERAEESARASEFDEESRPVVELVDLTVSEAIQRKVSDIHVEPMEDFGQVRYRIDGLLTKAREYPAELHSGVASRFKLLAGMDVAERRLPQDGRIRYGAKGAEVDLLVSSIVTARGESVALRVLPGRGARCDLSGLGMQPELLESFRKSLATGEGLVLVAGPTGSGKTTTLHAALSEMGRPETKIVTLEDPIERRLEGAHQVLYDVKLGITFAAGVRALLRQAPDVLMVGEIRDADTAGAVIGAAVAGHLVLSSLHAGNAPATLARLAELGVEPGLLSAALRAVLAQRLVRRVCKFCAIPLPPSQTARDLFRANGVEAPSQLSQERGCEACSRTGFNGRLGLHELMLFSDELRLAVGRGASERDLQSLARAAGLKTLMQDGLQKVAARETTLREVLRVLGGNVEELQ